MLSFHARKRQLTQFLESSAASKEPAIGPWTERCHGTFSDRIHCRHVVPPSSTNKLWAGRLWGHLFSQLFTKFVEFLRVSPCPLQDSQSEQSRLEASTYTKCVKTPLTLSTLLEDALLDALLQLHVPFPKFRTNAIFVHATQLRKECVHVHGMLDWIQPQIFFDPKVLHSWHVLLSSASHFAPCNQKQIRLSACQNISCGEWISTLSSMAGLHPKLCWNADLFSWTNTSHVTCLSKSKSLRPSMVTVCWIH